VVVSSSPVLVLVSSLVPLVLVLLVLVSPLVLVLLASPLVLVLVSPLVLLVSPLVLVLVSSPLVLLVSSPLVLVLLVSWLHVVLVVSSPVLLMGSPSQAHSPRKIHPTCRIAICFVVITISDAPACRPRQGGETHPRDLTDRPAGGHIQSRTALSPLVAARSGGHGGSAPRTCSDGHVF
jgi:hypothetical protein